MWDGVERGWLDERNRSILTTFEPQDYNAAEWSDGLRRERRGIRAAMSTIRGDRESRPAETTRDCSSESPPSGACERPNSFADYLKWCDRWWRRNWYISRHRKLRRSRRTAQASWDLYTSDIPSNPPKVVVHCCRRSKAITAPNCRCT